MGRMIAFRQCCSVMGILGWGKRILGRKPSCPGRATWVSLTSGNNSSLVIDRLSDRSKGKNTAVVGLYCDFLAQQEQSTINMLGAILKQLFGREEIPEHQREVLQNAGGERGSRVLRLPDMVKILNETITSLQRIYVCIDAIDELAPKYRQELLRSLQAIVRVSPNMRILLTGRSHVDDEIMGFFTKAVKIPIRPSQDDIKRFLKMKLKGDTAPKAMDAQLRANIMRVIPVISET